MSTLIKPTRRLRPVRRKAASSPVLKAAPGNPFAGVEYVFGSMSFTPLKGKALKQHIRARILADHHTCGPGAGGRQCQYDQRFETAKDGSSPSNGALQEYLGADGLMDLLFMLSENEAPADEIIEMIKRLHIPGYEHAHRHFDAAIAAGVFESNTKPGFYGTDAIKATLAWAKKQKRR